MIKVQIEYRTTSDIKETAAQKTTVYLFGIKVFTKTLKPNANLLRDNGQTF